MRRRFAGLAAAAGVACVAALGTAMPAQASSCAYLTHTVVLYMPGATDGVDLRRVGDAIYNGATPCGGATVHNTDLILIHDTTSNRDGDDLVGIDLSGGPFAPGLTSEGPGGVSEIEIYLFLYRGTNTVLVTGSNGADDLHAGVTFGPSSFVRGINLNAGADADADVTYQEAALPNSAANEPLIFDGGAGDDTIDAAGGAGFNTGLMQPVTLIGSGGDDHLVGGSGSDLLYADPGRDVLDGDFGPDTVSYQTSPGPVTVDLGRAGPQNTGALGSDQVSGVERLVGSPYDDALTGRNGDTVIQAGGGDDSLTGRGANDTLDGGWGSDTASYRPAAAGVTVNLGTLGPQSTGGAGADTLSSIENLAGSPFADHLTGDGQANTLTGGQGADSLDAAGGDDHLEVRDSTRDLVTCGPGVDSVTADQRAVDAVFGDCETTAFAPFVPPPSVPAATAPVPAPGGGGSTGTAPADTLAPVLDRLALSRRTLAPARRRTTVSFRLSEAAITTFSVQRARAGRWRRVRGTFARPGLAGVNRLRFSGRVAGKRLRPGHYRLRAVASDVAGNRSRPRVARFTIGR